MRKTAARLGEVVLVSWLWSLRKLLVTDESFCPLALWSVRLSRWPRQVCLAETSAQQQRHFLSVFLRGLRSGCLIQHLACRWPIFPQCSHLGRLALFLLRFASHAADSASFRNSLTRAGVDPLLFLQYTRLGIVELECVVFAMNCIECGNQRVVCWRQPVEECHAHFAFIDGDLHGLDECCSQLVKRGCRTEVRSHLPLWWPYRACDALIACSAAYDARGRRESSSTSPLMWLHLEHPPACDRIASDR